MLLPAIWLPPAQNKQQKTGEAMSSIHRPSAPSTGFAFVAMFLVTLMLVMHQPVHCQAAPAAPTAAATVDEGQLKSAVLGDAGFLASNVFSFWQQHGLDSEYGGFHGTLDRAGTAVAPTSNLLALEGHNSADTPCLVSVAASGVLVCALRKAFGRSVVDVLERMSVCQRTCAPLSLALTLFSAGFWSLCCCWFAAAFCRHSQPHSGCSTFHLQGYGKSGSPIAQQMAASAFDFVVQHIRDPADGLWYVSATCSATCHVVCAS